jgi:endonuclease-3
MPLKTDVVCEIFERLRESIPHPVSELNYRNEFTFCIAVLLSAQSTDKAVNLATKSLFDTADTPEKMLKLGEENLTQYIKTIGLYNNKCRNIIKLSEKLVLEYGSQVPRSREDLERLPGIGRKSANVILNTLFGVPCIAVDTHVFRVSKRIWIATSNTTLGVEKELMQTVPEKFHGQASNILVLHGRYTCTAKNPKCDKCCIPDLCKHKLRMVATGGDTD